jgi:hypothetical protein
MGRRNVCRLKQRFQLPSLIHTYSAFAITLATNYSSNPRAKQTWMDGLTIPQVEWQGRGGKDTETLMKNLVLLERFIECLECEKYYGQYSHIHVVTTETGIGVPIYW